MKEEIKKLAKHRLSRSRSTLEEGEALLNQGFFSGSVNRFYYAAFYAAKAVFAIKNLDSSKHSGAIALFNEHFVRTGIIDKDVAKAFSRSFERRQDSDYEDFSFPTEKEAASLKDQVEAFIDACEKIFKESFK